MAGLFPDNNPLNQRMQSQLQAAQMAVQQAAQSPSYNVPRVPTKYPYAPGNIDINQRIGKLGTPLTRNPDGSASTVYSSSFRDASGREVLIPTVIPDQARGGFKLASMPEAIDHYNRTGEHLGMFANSNDADEYAKALHEDLAVKGGMGLLPEEQMNKLSRMPIMKGNE